MELSRKNLIRLGLFLITGLIPFNLRFKKLQAVASTSYPLPSWQESKNKTAIIDFVNRVTNQNHPDFVPPASRIAVFDNDGTLWSEYPAYVQVLFVQDRIKALASQHPEWQNQQPFQAILNDNLESIGEIEKKALLSLVAATHAGLTTTEFSSIVEEWITTAVHPVTKRLYTEMVFQPMLELLSYFRENQFKTYIVSGGGIEFMRVWTESVYGIPPEQVIGSSLKTVYEFHNGQAKLVKLPEIDFINDKENKPVGIEKLIGRIPIAAFGNSDGDLQMLEWVSTSSDNSLAVLIHHTDDVREAAYDRNSAFGRLDKALDMASSHNWFVVDMKKDWKVIHPWELLS